MHLPLVSWILSLNNKIRWSISNLSFFSLSSLLSNSYLFLELFLQLLSLILVDLSTTSTLLSKIIRISQQTLFLVLLLLLLSLILFDFKQIVFCRLFDLVLQILNCFLIFVVSKQTPLLSVIYFINCHRLMSFLSWHLFIKAVVTHKS